MTVWAPKGPIGSGLLRSLIILALGTLSITYVLLMGFNFYGYFTEPSPFLIEGHAFSWVNPILVPAFMFGAILSFFVMALSNAQVFMESRRVMFQENRSFWVIGDLESKLDKSAKINLLYRKHGIHLSICGISILLGCFLFWLFKVSPIEMCVAFLMSSVLFFSVLTLVFIFITVSSKLIDLITSLFNPSAASGWFGNCKMCIQNIKTRLSARGAFDRLPSAEKEAAKQIAQKLNLDITHSSVMREVLSDYRARQKRAHQEAKMLGEKTQSAESTGQSRRL